MNVKKIFFLAMALCLAFGGLAYADLSDGLVAYYPFNRDATDESGNGNDGTVNGATLAEDRHGNIDSAYSFDGVDDFIRVSKNDRLNFGLSVDFTMIAWIKAQKYQKSYPTIIGRRSPGPSNGYIFFLGWGGERLSFQLNDGGFTNYSSTSDNLYDNSWHYVVVTGDRNGMLTFYIDGFQQGTYSISSIGNINSDSDIFFGRDEQNSSGTHFNGVIDDIQIYNRVLSEIEIQKLYTEGSDTLTPTLDKCCSEAELEAAKIVGYDEGYANGKGDGYAEGIEYCKKNPAECGFDVPACDSCCGTTDGECVTIEPDLTLTVPCANYGDSQFYFNLLPYKNPDNPFDTNFYWMLDMDSIGAR